MGMNQNMHTLNVPLRRKRILRLKPVAVRRKLIESTSCGWLVFALILAALFFITLAIGCLWFKHLKPGSDEDVIRNRSHLRSSRDSSSDNSVEFVKPDSNGVKGFKTLGKFLKWATFPVWVIPYFMYKNQTLEKIMGFSAIIAFMLSGSSGGMFIMMSIALTFIGVRHFFPLNPAPPGAV